jgi:uncharacterized protein Yka (UPF0111/DUF47 family)
MVLARRVDEGLLALYEAAGDNARRASELLRDMLVEHPDRPELARDVLACEHRGDRLTHDIIHRLNGEGGDGRAPFSTADGYELARTLDDIVDHAEQAADWLIVYGVEAAMEQAVALAEVLVAGAGEVAAALRGLRAGEDLDARLREIHRLENEGDRLTRDGMASLFATGIDPMVVIRWKDILASLEAAVDACETVAHLLEGILLKRSARRR